MTLTGQAQHITIIRPKPESGKGYTDNEWGAITSLVSDYYELVCEKLDLGEWTVCPRCGVLEQAEWQCDCEEE